MKKTYEKPVVMVEDFKLTQTISSCSGTKINALDYMCVMMDPNSPLILQARAREMVFMELPCTNRPIDESADDGFCFFTMTNMVFRS